MSSILAKLEVHSQLQALVFAVRHGVVEIPLDVRRAFASFLKAMRVLHF